MTALDRKYYPLFEKRTEPKHEGGWSLWENFGFRASWRLFQSVKMGEPFEARDFRQCVECDVADLLVKIRDQLGPQNERWAYDPEYVYFYFKTAQDFAEFRLTVELPND